MKEMMRTYTTFSLLIVALVFTACDQAEMPTTSLSGDLEDTVAPKNGEVIPGQYIVVLKSAEEFAGKTSRQVLDEMTSATGVNEIFRYESALNGFAGTFTVAAIERLRNHPMVDYIEKDRVITLPPFSALGRCDKNPDKPGCGGGGEEETVDAGETQSTPWGIEQVYGEVVATASNIGTAWVIDTGVDLDHRDLNVDMNRSQSFLSGKQSTNPDDQNGHGTHVAGTIAAIDNDVDVIGVAAGATVVSVRVLDRRGSGFLSGVIAGVDYVAAYGVSGDVANMSLGGGVSTALDDAVIAASSVVKFSLAAGNESDDADNHSPARANGSNIFTISAIDSAERFASWSNYGNPPIDFAAPGVSILSLWKNGGTKTISGTSMAAPHVAGILLLGDVGDGGSVYDSHGYSYPIAVHE